MFAQSEVQSDLDLLSAINLGDGNWQVTEVTRQFSLRSADLDAARRDGDSDPLRDVDGLLCFDHLHLLLRERELPIYLETTGLRVNGKEFVNGVCRKFGVYV